MKFILGLAFGMAITFTGAWYITFAQSAVPEEKVIAQEVAQIAPPQVADAAPPRKEETLTQATTEPPSAPAATTASPIPAEPAAQIDHLQHPEQPEQPEQPEVPEQSSEQVWTLFHSEASASGFANYLSDSIDHPFVVTKLGPAQYQVSYSYTNAEQAQALAEKINMITGAK